MKKAKLNAIKTARQWLSQNPVFLDTETTGLDDQAQVVDLALVDSDGTRLIDSLIRPSIPISAEAAAVHGIDNAMVAKAAVPTFGQVAQNLAKLTKDRLIIIYNADFDLRLIHQSAEDSWKLDVDYACAMRLYAEYYGDWNSYHRSYRWQSQAKAADQLGLSLPPDLHRAAADADLCRRIVEAVAATPLPGEDDG